MSGVASVVQRDRSESAYTPHLATGAPADWPGPGPIDLDLHDLPHASSTMEWWYVNTHLTLGVTGTIPKPGWRPTLRLYFIHQHEEGLVSVYDHPFGTVAGIGAGIRHRAGLGARLGLEIPFSKKKHVEWVALTGLDFTWLLTDKALGPALYVGAMGGVGLNYSLEELP